MKKSGPNSVRAVNIIKVMDRYSSMKRIIDIIISVLALVFLFPLILILSVLIKLEDGGSAIYSHIRLGKQRKPFRLLKFRSMVMNADEILFSNPELLENLRSGTHKLTNDPRVTGIGRFIRRYSLDEIPQFINVLKGEMSFVGPRAYRPDELVKYETEHPEVKNEISDILSVKPGITGLWQVSGRSEINFDQRIKLEASYARKYSLLLDFYIIFKTPLVVLQARGAV